MLMEACTALGFDCIREGLRGHAKSNCDSLFNACHLPCGSSHPTSVLQEAKQEHLTEVHSLFPNLLAPHQAPLTGSQ